MKKERKMTVQKMNSTLPDTETQTTSCKKKTTDIPTSWGAGNGGEQLMTKYVHIIKYIIPNKNLIDHIRILSIGLELACNGG